MAFFSRDIGLNTITLDNINLDVDYCYPKSTSHVKRMAWHNKYKQRKVSKKR